VERVGWRGRERRRTTGGRLEGGEYEGEIRKGQGEGREG